MTTDDTAVTIIEIERLDEIHGGMPAWLKGCLKGAAGLGGPGAIGGAMVFGPATLAQGSGWPPPSSPLRTAAKGAAVGAAISAVMAGTLGCVAGATGVLK